MSRTPNVYIGDVRKRPGVLALWEKQRNRKEIHWLVECFAEAVSHQTRLWHFAPR